MATIWRSTLLRRGSHSGGNTGDDSALRPDYPNTEPMRDSTWGCDVSPDQPFYDTTGLMPVFGMQTVIYSGLRPGDLGSDLAHAPAQPPQVAPDATDPDIVPLPADALEFSFSQLEDEGVTIIDSSRYPLASAGVVARVIYEAPFFLVMVKNHKWAWWPFAPWQVATRPDRVVTHREDARERSGLMGHTSMVTVSRKARPRMEFATKFAAEHFARRLGMRLV